MNKIKDEYNCALVMTHDLIGGKWKLRILWHIIHGDNRFSMLKKAIPDISEKVLISQLRELEASGLVLRHVIEVNPPMIVVYELAEEYSLLAEIIEKICEFTKGYAKNKRIVVRD